MELAIGFEREDDGRWIATIEDLPGVHVYGATLTEARSRVTALALRVIADQIESTQGILDEVGFELA